MPWGLFLLEMAVVSSLDKDSSTGISSWSALPPAGRGSSRRSCWWCPWRGTCWRGGWSPSDQEDGHDCVDEEFEHGLTLDQSEKYYWSFSVQQWFPLTMNENRDFYWNYPEQTWSRFKWNVDIYWCMHTKIYLYTSISNYSCIIISDKSDKSLVMYSSVLVTLAVSQEFI